MIDALVAYALEKGLIREEDRPYIVNSLLEALGLDTYENSDSPAAELEEILGALLDDAATRGVFEDSPNNRELFDTRLMGLLTPRPSAVIDRFQAEYEKSPAQATDWYYKFSQHTDYIRCYRIKKDVKWVTETGYGSLDITINLSKPEKDPRDIAAAKNAPQSGYPKCQLCRESEGYAGNAHYPARQNHRIIPLTLDGQNWFFQYSPYVYYNEHCIVLCGEHVPMKLSRSTFVRMFDFISAFPHYFIGSNADLPIVGGSILSHDHFQGGNYTFAMASAPVEKEFSLPGREDISIGRVKWPMSVLRLRGRNADALVDLADSLLGKWRCYSDASAFIFAETEGSPHNTITPIARRRGADYELDLVLRNNITTEEHPLGVFHPHAELHHIKKENIGLIEVMGLAVLPARLKEEIRLLSEALLSGQGIAAIEDIEKHTVWAEAVQKKHRLTRENIEEVLRQEIGLVFAQVLEDAGVFKRTAEGFEAFDRFLTHCGMRAARPA